ncbi:MAG: phosphoglycolate phosphatase, partial [Alphaproteobacteria bacterium]
MRLDHAVVFDLDGTLVDSVPDLHPAVNRLLAEEGQPPVSLAKMTAMVGEGATRLVQRAFAAVDIPLSEAAAARYTERFRELYLEAPCTHTTVMPHARDVLAGLAGRGVRLGLCTNKPIAHTRIILERLELAGYFGAVIGGDSLAVRKPDPAPLLATLAALGAEAHASVFVGDSVTDRDTARAAGVAVVLVEGGYTDVPVRTLAADAHAANLAEVAAL